LSLNIQNGFLTMDNNALLDREDEARFVLHGSLYDGYELALEYDERGYVKSISFGTTHLPRYIPERLEIDRDVELKGVWVGEFYDSFGFHMLELIVEDHAHGSIRDHQGIIRNLTDFKAIDGEVSGSFRYELPDEYARWGTKEYIDVNLELKATKDGLKGFIKSRGAVSKINLKRVS